MTTSLHAFCKDHNLPKSSVHRRCVDIGIDTSNGLNEAAIARLKAEFGVETVVDAEIEEAQPAPIIHAAGMGYAIPGISPSAIAQHHYSTDGLIQAKDAYQEAGQRATMTAAAMLQRYSQFKAMQTIQEIDAAWEGIKTAAMNSGLEQLGKPPAETPAPGA